MTVRHIDRFLQEGFVHTDRVLMPVDRCAPLDEHLGVHIRSHRPWIISVFPTDGLDVEATTIMSLIPLDD